MPDPEIEAMSSIADALSALDDEGARSRVLRWASEKFGVTWHHQSSGQNRGDHRSRSENDTYGGDQELDIPEDGDTENGGTPSGSGAPAHATFDHFAELFDAVRPKTDMEKAITAAYWEQIICGKKEWQSQALNKELKDLGHQITTINKALGSGISKQPALVLQLKKTGTTQQGRKTYKLSAEGVKFVRTRIEQSR